MIQLHVKESIFLIIIINTYYLPFCINGDDSSDSDDDRLKQALVLVDILKSEYIKKLHENAILREKQENETFEELSTCASTTSEGNFSSSYYYNNTTTNRVKVAFRPMLSSDSSVQHNITQEPTSSAVTQPSTVEQNLPLIFTRQPLPPIHPQNTGIATLQPLIEEQFYQNISPSNYPSQRFEERQIPNRAYRRMLPRNYDYYDNPSYIYENNKIRKPPFFYRRIRNGNLRFQYDDALITQHINKAVKNDTIVVTTASPTSLSPEPRTVVAKKPTKVQHVKKKTQLRRLQRNKENNKKKKVNRNPILHQVAKELMNEIGIARKSEKSEPSIKHNFGNVKNHFRRSFIQNNDTLTKSNVRTITTIRVHMGKSTRLPLPLSENNAYCFFSPKSVLCRSSI